MKFKKVSFKNFGSYGNKLTEFELDNNGINLITGVNGRGKSTVFSAVYFALYGKPLKDGVKKAQLVNTKNKKDCLVILEFEHDSNQYEVERGIKPDIFIIKKNGEEINQDAHSIDYQEVINQLIAMDYKVFRSSIMMDASTKSFLKRTPAEKRAFIENVLSIKIYGDISDVIKKQISSMKTEFYDVEKEIEKLDSNIQIIKDFNEKKKAEFSEKKSEIDSKIKELIEQNKDNEKEVDDYKAQKEKYVEAEDKCNQKIAELSKYETKHKLLRSKCNDINKDIEFFKSNDVCPTCRQEISSELVEQIESGYTTQLNKYKEGMTKLEVALSQISKVSEKCAKITQTIRNIDSQITRLYSDYRNNNNRIDDYKSDLNKINKVQNSESKDDSKYVKLKESNTKRMEEIQHSIVLRQKMIEILSEKGIKKFILNKYIPVLNSIINEYLEYMDAFYKIEFDENMDEKIVAVGYEKLSYDCFSAGEKQRVDIALMFAFLELSRMKNSVNTNLIMLDEILDMSLDDTGLNGVITIFERLKEKGYTVFVISCKDNLPVDRIDKVIEIEKGVFSMIKEV
ncbi:AAA family ATPase [uncultured Arcobacter sp.]|uniref:AAA family ATPase n=1 Tax=uncultured Arcobacter sp. TaxID=165434 RepID=UPI002601A0D0|nr:AAA family ATPase [uncultured Arcobacter sp.]